MDLPLLSTASKNQNGGGSIYVALPAAPDQALAAVERRFQRRAVLDDSPVDGGMIYVDTALEHQLFDMARAQRIRHLPAGAGRKDFLREVGTLEARSHPRSPSLLSL